MDSEAALLEAIYANPDDDGPRLVYMDRLLERGDRRGEFIALQMRAATTALSDDELARARALLRAHRRQWVPAPVLARIDGTAFRFERGFLARCRLRQSEKLNGSVQVGHPAWRTVHTVDAPGTGFGANRVLLAPELAGVRHVRIYGSALFAVMYLADPRIKGVE